MQMKEHAPGIAVFDNVLEDPVSFISNVESLVQIQVMRDWSKGAVLETKTQGKEVNTNYRDVACIGLPKFDLYQESMKEGPEYLVHDFLNKNLLPLFEDYCRHYGAPDWKTKDGWQILKYGPEQFFLNHRDDCAKFPRTISMSYYPNDNYEGGELVFPRFNLTIKPKANEAVFFPANYVYVHTVNKVTSGYRYAVVNWWDI